MTILRHSGARAISACTRVHSPSKTGVNALKDALWRANPEPITTTGSMDSGSALRASRNDKSRREFIAGLGGVAALSVPWPSGARAQQGERVRPRRIGILNTLAAEDAHGQERIGVFLQELKQAGWTLGGNLRIDQRWWAGGDPDIMRKQAAELVALGPDALLATGGVAIRPLLLATRTVPIVFCNAPDPVGAGYVDSLARPGGNVTGFTQFEYGTSVKWIELLKQIAPGVTRVAVLRDPNTPSGIGQFGAMQGAATSFGVELIPLGVDGEDEIKRAVASFARNPNGGLIVTAGQRTSHHRGIDRRGNNAAQVACCISCLLLCCCRWPNLVRARSRRSLPASRRIC